MTLLEFLIEWYIGPPIRTRGDGQSFWDCPVCGQTEKFHTLPDRQPYKHRARCWSCEFRGDVFDVLRFFHPEENFPQHRERLAQLEAKWRASGADSLTSPGDAGSTPVPRKCLACKLKDGNYDPQDEEFGPEADAAIDELLRGLDFIDDYQLIIKLCRSALHVLELCARHNIHPLGLASRCGFELWRRESDAAHMSECNGVDCDCACCRKARGWTDQELKADSDRLHDEHLQQVVAQRNRVDRALRRLRSRTH
jgi:hypothetical protein